MGACGPPGERSRSGDPDVFRACDAPDSVPALSESRCALVSVPLRHGVDTTSPTGADAPGRRGAPSDSVRIFVRKFAAEGRRRGEVWLLAGGPQSGAMFYPFVDRLRQAFPGFDLVVPDHRGTGLSTRICPDEEDVESAGGTGLSGSEFPSCYAYMRSHANYVRAFSLTANARDVALLVERLGSSGRRLLFGTSYGTRVALRILEATEARFDGVILDSFVPVQTDSIWGPTQRAAVTDAVGHAVLARCDNDAACRRRLGGDALGTYEVALDARERGDLELPASVPGGDLKSFMGRLLDFPESRARIPRVVEALASADSAAMADAVRGSLAAYRDAVEPVRGYRAAGLSVPFANTVLNSEMNLRPNLTSAALDRETDGLEFTHPLPYQLVSGREADLPLYQPGPFRSEEPDTIPPTLVLQGTLDTKTHYAGASEHVEALRGTGAIEMVSVRDGPHYLLMNAPRCFVRRVSEFVETGVPRGGWCADPHAALDFDAEGVSGDRE